MCLPVSHSAAKILITVPAGSCVTPDVVSQNSSWVIVESPQNFGSYVLVLAYMYGAAAPLLSTSKTRKPLRLLVHSWSQITGIYHAALWPQVKAHSPVPVRRSRSRSTATACRESGTKCGWRIFIFSAGMFQVAPSSV